MVSFEDGFGGDRGVKWLQEQGRAQVHLGRYRNHCQMQTCRGMFAEGRLSDVTAGGERSNSWATMASSCLVQTQQDKTWM